VPRWPRSRAHRLRTRLRDGLVFGAGDVPLDVRALQERADDAWATAGVARVTPHVCRHLYATLMAAAAVPMHALSRYMGHSSIAVTWDNYGHLFPGEEAQAAVLREAFLAGAAATTPAGS
jgi:integrase